MKKEVVRRDLLDRDTCLVMGIYLTESKGEPCRASALWDVPWQQSKAGWDIGISG